MLRTSTCYVTYKYPTDCPASNTLTFQYPVGSDDSVPRQGGNITLLGPDSFVIAYLSFLECVEYADAYQDGPVIRLFATEVLDGEPPHPAGSRRSKHASRLWMEGLTYEVAFEVGNPTAKNVTGPTDVQYYATVSGFSPFHDARELKLCPAFRIAHS